jgi:hypothetical protein
MTAEQRGELAWKWMLRLMGAASFGYVLLAKDGNVPVAVFAIIGGLIGLPNVIAWQSILNRKGGDE